MEKEVGKKRKGTGEDVEGQEDEDDAEDADGSEDEMEV